MNETEFRSPLRSGSLSPKVQGDIVSRARKLQKILDSRDFDEEF